MPRIVLTPKSFRASLIAAALIAAPCVARATCIASSSTWQNQSFSQQTGPFTAQFDATPSASGIDGVAGLSSGTAAAYGGLANIARFNTSGLIDGRNGGAYTSISSIPYTGGKSYHFLLGVNFASHTYSAFVSTPNASSQQVIGDNFAFRTEQSGTNFLQNLGLFVDIGSETVCNLATASEVLFDDFSSYTRNTCFTDGTVFGPWTDVFGGGTPGVNSCTEIISDGYKQWLQLSPEVATIPTDTHASLSTGTFIAAPSTFTVHLNTLAQLRTGSAPNNWEVGWVLWDYTDDNHFYDFIPKVNGWELDKEDPAYPGNQRIMATGGSPNFSTGTWHYVQVVQTVIGSSNTMTVSVDGTQYVTYTDTATPYFSGNIGVYTEEATVAFEDVAVDTKAPVTISAVGSSVSYNNAAIYWTTDVAATSQVQYGGTSNYTSVTVLSTTPVTNHTVILNQLADLAPFTTYHYRVMSQVPYKASTYTAASPDYTFTTGAFFDDFSSYPPGNCIPQGVSTGPWTNVAAGGTGNCTQVSSDGYKQWMQLNSANPGDAITTGTYVSGTSTYSVHMNTLAQLAASPPAYEVGRFLWDLTSTTSFYYFMVKPGSGWELGKGATTLATGGTSYPIQTWYFVQIVQNVYPSSTTISAYINGTLATTYTDSSSPYTGGYIGLYAGDAIAAFEDIAVDTTAPTSISGVSSSANSSSATITWTTDVPATSQVQYGGTTNYASVTTFNSSLVTSHSVLISGLSASTLYHFRALSSVSTPISTYTAASADYNFTTTSGGGGGGGSCSTSTGNWVNIPFSQEISSFTADFDATPAQTNLQALIGFSSGTVSASTGMAGIVRFNTSDQLDVRYTTAYMSLTPVSYTSSSTYHFHLRVNVQAHLYDAYVTPPGSGQTQLARNSTFQTGWSTITVLNNLGFIDTGSMTVCNLTIAPSTVPWWDGIKEIYVTAIGSKTWYSTWDDGINRSIPDPYITDANQDPVDPWWDPGHGDAGFTISGGSLTVSPGTCTGCDPEGHPRIYVRDPDITRSGGYLQPIAYSQEWHNVEATAYGYLVAYDSVTVPAGNYAGLEPILRTNHGVTNYNETTYPCDNRSLGARIRFDGHTDFEKETTRDPTHGGVSTATANMPLFVGRFPYHQWIGIKHIAYDLPNGDPVDEEWVDITSSGTNGGTWVLQSSFTDTGGIWAPVSKGGVSCNSSGGIDPSIQLQNNDTRTGSESGHPNPSVFFRNDNILSNGFIYKKMSFREIVPPTPP